MNRQEDDILFSMTVRVVGGENVSSQVELFYKGTWGSVRFGYPDTNEAANLVCRELGLGKALTASKTTSRRLSSFTKIWCSGNEDSIIECVRVGWFNSSNQPRLVASVDCSRGKITDSSLYHHVLIYQ